MLAQVGGTFCNFIWGQPSDLACDSLVTCHGSLIQYFLWTRKGMHAWFALCVREYSSLSIRPQHIKHTEIAEFVNCACTTDGALRSASCFISTCNPTL